MRNINRAIYITTYILLGTYVIFVSGFWGAEPSWIVQDKIIDSNIFEPLYFIIYLLGGLSRPIKNYLDQRLIFLVILLDILIFIPLLNWIDPLLIIIYLIIGANWVRGLKKLL